LLTSICHLVDDHNLILKKPRLYTYPAYFLPDRAKSSINGLYGKMVGSLYPYPIPCQMTAGLAAAPRLLLKVMPAVTAVLLPALLANNASSP